MGAYRTPKVFFFFLNTAFLLLNYSACKKKLQRWSLYEVIKDILLFVLNTKQPLSDICKTVLGVLKKIKISIFSKK